MKSRADDFNNRLVKDQMGTRRGLAPVDPCASEWSTAGTPALPLPGLRAAILAATIFVPELFSGMVEGKQSILMNRPLGIQR
jgi:hypothetical protein